MNYIRAIYIILFVLSLSIQPNLQGMEHPEEEPHFYCKVPFVGDEFPDEIPVRECSYTTLLYNENNISYHYAPDPDNPTRLIQIPCVTFNRTYQSKPPQHEPVRTQSSYINRHLNQLHERSYSFRQRSAYYADRDFAIDRYLHIYNQLNESDQGQFAYENEYLHELAMRRIAYENQPPFRQRVKDSLSALGEKLSSTKDRIASWWHGNSSDDNPEKEASFPMPESTYKSQSTELIQQSQAAKDPFKTDTVVPTFEKKDTELIDEDFHEQQKDIALSAERFSLTTYPSFISDSTSATSDDNASSSTSDSQPSNKPSPFPKEKPQANDDDKKSQVIPQEIREKYEKYKKYHEDKNPNQSTPSQQPITSSRVVPPIKEPMTDVIRQDSKEFIAKLNLPSAKSSNSSTRSTPPIATSLPTSPLHQINSYDNYATSRRTSSTQSGSLHAQRQVLNNQINQIAQRESSTVRAWGGSQERRKLEAEQRKINAQIRYQENVASYSGGGSSGGYSSNEYRYPKALDHFSCQNKRKIRYLLKNDLVSKEDKEFINSAWNDAAKNHGNSEFISQNPLVAKTTNFYSGTDGRILSQCYDMASSIYNEQYTWEEEVLLPILRANNFDQANTLTSKNITQEQWLNIRRRLEKHHSNVHKIHIRPKYNEVSKKIDEEYKKINHTIGYIDYYFSYDAYYKIKSRVEKEFLDKHIDEISQEKNLEYQQKLAAEKLELERRLAAEKAEHERLQKELEKQQKKEEHAKRVGTLLDYEATKRRLQQEFELEQAKERLEELCRMINAPSHYHEQRELFYFSNNCSTPVTSLQNNSDNTASFLSFDADVATSATDFITTSPYGSKQIDPKVIEDLITHPDTSESVIETLKKAQELYNNTDDKILKDISVTVTDLLVYGETISKKISESDAAYSKAELERYKAIKEQTFEIASTVIHVIYDELDKIGEKNSAQFHAILAHPLEMGKHIISGVGTQVYEAIEKLGAMTGPIDSEIREHISESDMSSLKQKAQEERERVIDAIEKKVLAFNALPAQEKFRVAVRHSLNFASQVLVAKACSLLNTTMRPNTLTVNAIEAAAALESATQQRLAHAVEGKAEGTLSPAEKASRAQKVQEIVDLSREYSQSERAKEFLAKSDKRFGHPKFAKEVPSAIDTVSTADGIKYAKDKIAQFVKISEKDSIWSKITPTQEFWPHTNIPKSFVIDCQGKKIWINANATEHLMEHTAPSIKKGRGYIDPLRSPGNIPASEYRLSQEMLLDTFYESLENAISEGINFSEKGVSGGTWRFVFSKPSFVGGHIQVHHIESNLWK